MSTPKYSERYIYVPAAPGWEAVNVFEVLDLDLDLDETRVEMDTFPVIAWRINETTTTYSTSAKETEVDGFLGSPVLAESLV